LTWDPELNELMMLPIGVQRNTGVNNYGEPQLGPVTTYYGHYLLAPVRVLTMSGQETVVQGTVWFRGDDLPNLRLSDNIILPDGSTPGSLVRVDHATDEDGVYYEKAYF
jgi:DNA-directed RNA polymerase subunit H (RpoH/RPB5)